MKKKISVLFAVILGLTAALTGCGKEKKEEGQLVPVTLNEVAHSVFYAPQYVAIEEGYFVKAGIKLELVTGFGADKVMAAILSGDADIGFMGSEASIYACLLYTSCYVFPWVFFVSEFRVWNIGIDEYKVVFLYWNLLTFNLKKSCSLCHKEKLREIMRVFHTVPVFVRSGAGDVEKLCF